jgi:hypothetical protein
LGLELLQLGFSYLINSICLVAVFLFLLYLLTIIYRGRSTGEPERRDKYAQPEDPWIKQAEHPADGYDGAKWERYYDARYGRTGSSPTGFPYRSKGPQKKTSETSDERDSEPELNTSEDE